MKELSQRTLQMIDDLVRALDFEMKTGNRLTLEVSPNVFDTENFAKRRTVFLNGQKVGEITQEILPFV